MNRVIRKDDCEIIEVQNTLKEKVVISGTGGVDRGAIERAETALKHLSVQFDSWLEEETRRLVAARNDVRENGLDEPNFGNLFRAAHDIKGQGETLGYPVATKIAASLCTLLEAPEDRSRIPLALIDHHVDALWRVMHDRIKETDDETVRAVTEQLIDVVIEFAEHEEQIKQANRDKDA